MLGVKIINYLQILTLADLFSIVSMVKNAKNIKLKSHKVDENLRKISSVRSNPELKYNNYFAKITGVTSDEKLF